MWGYSRAGTQFLSITAFPRWSKMPSLPYRWETASSCPVWLAEDQYLKPVGHQSRNWTFRLLSTLFNRDSDLSSPPSTRLLTGSFNQHRATVCRRRRCWHCVDSICWLSSCQGRSLTSAMNWQVSLFTSVSSFHTYTSVSQIQGVF